MWEPFFEHLRSIPPMLLLGIPMVLVCLLCLCLFLMRLVDAWRVPKEETLEEMISRIHAEAGAWPPPPKPSGSRNGDA